MENFCSGLDGCNASLYVPYCKITLLCVILLGCLFVFPSVLEIGNLKNMFCGVGVGVSPTPTLADGMFGCAYRV